jgi:hypothetical protein
MFQVSSVRNGVRGVEYFVGFRPYFSSLLLAIMEVKMIARFSVLTFFLLLAFAVHNSDSKAQLNNPNFPFKSRLTLQSDGVNAALTVHRSPLGKPCLNMEAASRAQIINPDLYDNIVSIQNQCSKKISVKVCYYGTEICVDVEVLAQQRKDVTIGIRPHTQYFRYSYQEKF